MIDPHVKCTKLPVQNVEQKPKYPSSLMERDQFIVKTVIKPKDQRDTRPKSANISSNIKYKFL